MTEIDDKIAEALEGPSPETIASMKRLEEISQASYMRVLTEEEKTEGNKIARKLPRYLLARITKPKKAPVIEPEPEPELAPEPDLGNTFAKLPKQFIKWEWTLTPAAVRVYMNILGMINAKSPGRGAWPSQATLAKLTHLKPRTVVRSISELESKGWITVTYHGYHNSNIYRIRIPTDIEVVSKLNTAAESGDIGDDPALE